MDDRNKSGSDKDRQQGNQKGTGSQGGQGQSAGRRPATQGEPGAGRTPGGKVGQKSGPDSPHRQQTDDDDQDQGK
jgi:hypothetical protein